jgi:hypothetical protein
VAVAVLAELWRFENGRKLQPEKRPLGRVSRGGGVCGLTSGSGLLQLVPLDRGDQGGSNGGS